MNPKKRLSLGMAMIMKDEVDDLDRILKNYSQYFDQIYLTVTNKQTYDQLSSDSKFKKLSKIHISYFKWKDHYGEARRFNHKQIKTDYWMWIDLDDEIIGAEKIRKVLDVAVKEGIDAIYLPYDYYQNQYGDSQSILQRERILKTSNLVNWENRATHETVMLPEGKKTKKVSEISIKHHKSFAAKWQSIANTKDSLEKEWESKKDPQTGLYLSAAYLAQESFVKALNVLTVVANIGNERQKLRAWNNIASLYRLTKYYDLALQAADHAIKIDPDYPDSWYEKTQIYMETGDYGQAAESADIASTKSPNNYDDMAFDPTKYTYKGTFLAARAHLYNKDTDKAYNLFKTAQKLSPGYIKDQSHKTINWQQVFKEAYKNPEILNDMLPCSPHKWPTKSIAYYVGQGVENWGPDTLSSGMGSSEEAVIYLSRELAKLGWDVTVFCQRNEEYIDKFDQKISPVKYVPWFEMNLKDTYDVFIASRQPLNLYKIKARLKILDMHDVMPEDSLLNVASEVHKFFVKSKWQRNLYPNIPDDKFVIIGNGINKQTITSKKRKYSAGYFSSYDRGLQTLLDIWPDIRKAVPEATLDIYHGWNVFDIVNKTNKTMIEFKASLTEKINDMASLGVKEHGRVSHERLAEAMSSISTWLYPTQFREIHCITALKTAEANMHQVCTRIGALSETAPNATFIDSDLIYSDKKAQQQFIQAAITALKDPKPSAPPTKIYWKDIAKVWNKILLSDKDKKSI